MKARVFNHIANHYHEKLGQAVLLLELFFSSAMRLNLELGQQLEEMLGSWLCQFVQHPEDHQLPLCALSLELYASILGLTC